MCSARIRTINDTEHGNASDYSHPPNGAHNVVLKALDKMKTRAEQTEEVTSRVINTVTEELPLKYSTFTLLYVLLSFISVQK